VSQNKICHETGNFKEMGLTVLIMPKIVVTSDQWPVTSDQWPVTSPFRLTTKLSYSNSENLNESENLWHWMMTSTLRQLHLRKAITWYKRIKGSVGLRPGLGAAEQKILCLYTRNNPLLLGLPARTLGKHWHEQNTCPSEESRPRPLPKRPVTRLNRNQLSSVDSIPART